MRPFLKLAFFPAAAVLLAGCQIMSAVNLKRADTPDAPALKRLKTVAVMPFFYANAVGADDPSYKGKWSDMMPTANVYAGIQGKAAWKLVSLDDTMAALKKRGFSPLPLQPGEELSMMKALTHPDLFRAGLTMQQALGAGKDLGADAILMGSYGMHGNAPANMRVVMAMRLVDPKDGRVLWGAARADPMKTSLLHPIEAQKEQMRTMAMELVAEAQ